MDLTLANFGLQVIDNTNCIGKLLYSLDYITNKKVLKVQILEAKNFSR